MSDDRMALLMPLFYFRTVLAAAFAGWMTATHANPTFTVEQTAIYAAISFGFALWALNEGWARLQTQVRRFGR
ncbi:hypothetical protein [Kitasatospora sp. NPDC002965]|uniref:hypothetical protein n=1 Tax=Kitasatospora sp. NPDC002965 TaxID=3154775 RepID=UPI0033B70EEC